MNNKILIASGLVLLYLLLRKKDTTVSTTQTFDILSNAIVTQGLTNEYGDYKLTIMSEKPIQASYIKGSKVEGDMLINVSNLRINSEYIPTFDKINGIKKTLKCVC